MGNRGRYRGLKSCDCILSEEGTMHSNIATRCLSLEKSFKSQSKGNSSAIRRKVLSLCVLPVSYMIIFGHGCSKRGESPCWSLVIAT